MVKNPGEKKALKGTRLEKANSTRPKRKGLKLGLNKGGVHGSEYFMEQQRSKRRNGARFAEW